MSEKNVYIIGAGFSKYLDLPLQDNFLAKAKDIYFGNQEKYKHFSRVFNYQQDLSNIRMFFSFPLHNLESLFNLLEMDYYYSGSRKAKQIRNNFVSLIKDVLVEVTPPPFYKSTPYKVSCSTNKYELYFKFLTLFIQKNNRDFILNDDSIISFNYDLVLESAFCIYNRKYRMEKYDTDVLLGLDLGIDDLDIKFDELSKYYKTTVEERFFSNTIGLNTKQKIKLFKLHGSINWLNNNGIMIIPPTWNKSSPKMKKLWQKAFLELSTAKRIIIIGYSFPETDVYVKALLGLAVNKNKRLQNIYFINPDTEIAKGNSLSFIDKHFQSFCKFFPLTFDQIFNTKEGNNIISEYFDREVYYPKTW